MRKWVKYYKCPFGEKRVEEENLVLTVGRIKKKLEDNIYCPVCGGMGHEIKVIEYLEEI